MRPVTPREALFGAAVPRWQGQGARVLLMDAVPADIALLGPSVQPLHAADANGSAAAQCAFRRISMLCDGNGAAGRAGGDLGVAGRARIHVAADARTVTGDFSELEALVREHGPFDVIAFCRGLELAALGPGALSVLSRLAAGALLVAADADEHEPDWGPDVVLVTARPATQCAGPRVVLDLQRQILARAPDLALGHLPSGEAGAALVAGLIACWCQRLREEQVELDGPMLRALLLAAGAHSRSAGMALGATLSDEAPPLIRRGADAALHLLPIRADGCLAVVHHGVPASPLWVPPEVELELELENAGGTVVHEAQSGNAWGSVSWTAAPDRALTVALAGGVPMPASGLDWVCFGARAANARRCSPAPSSRPLTVVGVAASHDASACVLRDGRVIAAIQLERLTRQKHDGRAFLHAREAVDYCLATAGLRERDVDYFAFNCMPLAPTFTGLSVPSHDATFELFDPFGERAVFVSHHLCHAFGAYLGSSFDAATVIVCDGSGGSTVGKPDVVLRGPELADYLATRPQGDEGLHVFSAYHFTPSGWSLVEREHASSFNVLTGHTHLGEMYAAASQYVFGDWQESGKLMGLAPYGVPELFGPSLLVRDADGRLQFSAHWKNQLRAVLHKPDPLVQANFAARVQRDLETALLDRVSRSVEKSGERRVAYAGGVALNSVANQRLRAETGMSALYVMPASHDAGISIGAAAAAQHLATGRLEPSHLVTDAFGHAYQRRDYELAIDAHRHALRVSDVSLPEVAERLASDQVVGWFQGGSEFGPRALGQRSILAAATRREMWQHINRRIKYREDFRPFAPVVPEEVADRYFELDEPSPFMLRVVKVRERYRDRLGAVTHVDGSARVQTVNARVLPTLHALLHAYGAKSGMPVLVNTSLNVRGEPLVETPREAVEMLLATHLDALVFEGRTLLEPLPPAREALEDAVLMLAPKCVLESRADLRTSSYGLVAEARGHQRVNLPKWAFELLRSIDGRHSLRELLSRTVSKDRRAEALELASALSELRLLLVTHPRSSAAIPAPAAPLPPAAPSAPALDASECCTDPTPLLPGTGRTMSTTETIARVERHLLPLGVSRVADLTEYDYLGVPVFSCIRPFVENDDITCTQGKGLTKDAALASALMETVERFCAYHRAHVQTRICTPAELARSGEPWLPLSALGGMDVLDAPIEWVWAHGARGQSRWVAACSAFAPYRAPAGVRTPFTWCTTGLSAGNTINEALAHGMLEVMERDALSRYIAGAPAAVLDLETVPAGPERDLLARFQRAHCELFVIDLSKLAPVPTFSLALFDPEGPEPRLPVAGQGAGLSAAVALRRAALEAAQSRVVAIQGSREDLVRHGTRWLEDPAARIAHFRESHSAASRGGTSRFAADQAPESVDPSTLGQLLASLFGRLEARGHRDVLYVDLTHPTLQIPVVATLIPGMYDAHGVSGKRPHDEEPSA